MVNYLKYIFFLKWIKIICLQLSNCCCNRSNNSCLNNWRWPHHWWWWWWRHMMSPMWSITTISSISSISSVSSKTVSWWSVKLTKNFMKYAIFKSRTYGAEWAILSIKKIITNKEIIYFISNKILIKIRLHFSLYISFDIILPCISIFFKQPWLHELTK